MLYVSVFCIIVSLFCLSYVCFKLLKRIQSIERVFKENGIEL